MIVVHDASSVRRLLDYPGCIAAMREAMVALSTQGRDQPLRQVLPLKKGGLFGIMPGDLPALNAFGAKFVSVFPDPAHPGRTRHRGMVAAFDDAHGELICLADAEAITEIRTACATAAATDALARDDARVLTIFGTGAQAESHIGALRLVRPFEEILVWGRSRDAAAALADRMSAETTGKITAVADASEAAARADVIVTVTGSREPILEKAWVAPGTHVNLIGSSMLGPVEVDTALVQVARYIADYRAGAIAQASELAIAIADGAVTEAHIKAEIGEVFAGTAIGRAHASQITIYKSLGHVAQDLAAALYVHSRASSET